MKINEDLLKNAKICSNIYADEFKCRNLLDESNITSAAKSAGITYDGSKVYSTSPSTDNRAWNYDNANYYITLDAGTYTLSLNFIHRVTNSSGGLFRFFKEDNTFIGNLNAYNVDNASVTFTLSSATKLGLYFKLYDGQVNIQIESGNEITGYTPFTYANKDLDNALQNIKDTFGNWNKVSMTTNLNAEYWAYELDYVIIGKVAFCYIIVNIKSNSTTATDDVYFEMPFTFVNNWYFPAISSADASTSTTKYYLQGGNNTNKLKIAKSINRNTLKANEVPSSGYLIDTQFFAFIK